MACLAVASGAEQLLALAQAFAPEHLQLVGAEAEALADRVTRAGCLFVGAGAGTAFGDYIAGSNHILPTNGAARFASAVSPEHFLRRFSEVHIDAAAELAPVGGAAGPGGGLRAARAVDGGTHKERIDGGAWRRRLWGEWERMTRIGLIERKTAETEIKVSLVLDGQRRRRARHRRRLLRPHARPARPARPSRPGR